MRTYPIKLKPLEMKLKYIIPNGHLSGTTWDAKHLDSFLQDNTQNYKNEYFEKKRQLLDLKNQTLLTAGTSKSKESCIFRSKPRFSNHPSGYTLNDFPQFFSDMNDMAITQNGSKPNKNTSLPTIEIAYSQKAQKKEFDESKLEPVRLPLKCLSTSKEKRNELSDLQNNRKEYSKWKKELANLTKKKRLLHNNFKSGALNVDNPLNDNSFYYNDLGQELKKKHDIFQYRQERHRSFLDDHFKTSENIKFDNRYALDRTKTEKSDFDETKKKNIDDFWKVKKKNSMNAVRNKKTNERIFGSDESKNQLLNRAVFLREMETRNKKYNIVSLNYYEPEIIPECYKKVRDKTALDFFFKN